MKRNVAFKITIMILFITSSFLVKARIAQKPDISITDFKVVIIERKDNINWSTDKMNTTNYFEVEKSMKGKNYKTVAYVLGADPVKKNWDSYGCFDNINKSADKYYYHIKHIDSNGVVEFSGIKFWL